MSPQVKEGELHFNPVKHCVPVTTTKLGLDLQEIPEAIGKQALVPFRELHSQISLQEVLHENPTMLTNAAGDVLKLGIQQEEEDSNCLQFSPLGL